MNPVRVVVLALVTILGITGIASLGKMAESVGAGELVVCQDPFDGDLTWYTAPGVYYQNFGDCTHYRKSVQIWFTDKDVQGVDSESAPLKIRFNDGGHAMIHGSIRSDFPSDTKLLNELHARYGSQLAVEQQLIGTVVAKSIYMTGPLMSSTESYAERRNDLITYIEDQAMLGVYRTQSRDIKTKDPLSGDDKTVKLTEILRGENGLPLRQEESAVSVFQIRLYNFSPTSIDYDDLVEKQITQQQGAIMQVQTAMANAKKAEQDAITAEQQGRANYQTSKWKQEELNATEIAIAEKNLKVKELDAQTAAAEKQADILRGQGEGERKRLVMQADGALDKKLDAWTKAQELWANAFAKYPGRAVPEVVIGGSGGHQGTAAQTFMDMLSIKAARDLALDMTMPQGAVSKK